MGIMEPPSIFARCCKVCTFLPPPHHGTLQPSAPIRKVVRPKAGRCTQLLLGDCCKAADPVQLCTCVMSRSSKS